MSLLARAVGGSPHLARIPELFVRDNEQCAISTYSPCADLRIPRNRCCAPKTKCISLENSNSMICCPDGEDCKTINTVDCQACRTQSSVDQNNSACSVCNDQCCPGGYSCNNGQCVIKPDALTNTSSSSSASSTASTGGSSTVTSTTTSTTGGASATSKAAEASMTTIPISQTQASNPWPVNAILVGLLCGIVAGLLLCLLGVLLYRQWQRRKNKRDSDKSFGNLTSQPSPPSINSRSPFRGIHARTPDRGGSEQLHDPALMRELNYLAPAIVRQSTSLQVQTNGSLGRTHQNPNLYPYNDVRASHATTIESDTTPIEPGTERIDIFADPITANNSTYTSPYSSHHTPQQSRELPRYNTPPELPTSLMASHPRQMREVEHPGGSPIFQSMGTSPRPTPPPLAPPIELVADNQPRHIPKVPPHVDPLQLPVLRPFAQSEASQRPYSHTTDGGKTTFGDFLTAGQIAETPAMPSFPVTSATGGLVMGSPPTTQMVVPRGQPQIKPGHVRQSSEVEIMNANRRSRGGGPRQINHRRTESEQRKIYDVRGSFNGEECIPPLRFDGNATRGQRLVRGNGGRWRG